MTISAQVVQYPMQLKHLTTTSSLWPGFQFRRSGEKSVQSVERKCFRRSGRDYVLRCCNSRKAVDIGEAAFITSLNLMSRMLFSSDFASYDTYSSQEIKNVVFAVSTCLGLPNLSDYFPVLESIDPQGIMRNSKPCCQSLFDIFDVIIKERLLARERSSETKKNDVLEALLDEHVKNDSEFSLDILKHLLFDLFVGGVDATLATVEWAMAELLRSNSERIEKAREELNQVIGSEEGVIQESDISRLPYLRAILNETLRLHPPAPLLVPHKANEDVEINGYIVPKETQILVNAYNIGRDETIWPEPEMFKPERFLESEIDVKGMHFELIPFGSGRRMCPGFPLAYRMVHIMLATLIYNIDWKLEGGSNRKIWTWKKSSGCQY